MRRPEWLELNPAIRILYLSLWCYALDSHRQAVKKLSSRGMAALTGLKACQCNAYLSRLHALGYLIVSDETITMCGIVDKHPKYIWYDSPDGDRMGIKRGSKSPHKEKETETETDKEKEDSLVRSIDRPKPTAPQEIPDLTLEAEEIQKPKEMPVITIPLNDGNEYPILQAHVSEWESLYGSVDVPQTLRRIRGHWLAQTKAKRKTKVGILKSINTWLASEQDKRGSVGKIESKEDRRLANNFETLRQIKEEGPP
jgi:hypothetical protein